MKQEDVLKFQLLSHELEQVQQFLTELERKMAEVTSLIRSLETFEQLPLGEETRFTLASGIFAHGKLTSRELLVNVGQGVVVKRSPKEVIGMIESQLSELQQQQVASAQQQQELYQKLQALEQQVTAELEAEKTQKKG